MLTLDQIDDDLLVELLQRRDPLGVLSVYADTRRGEASDPQAVPIDLKNRLRTLQRNISEEKAENHREISAALDRMSARIEALSDPFESGRGRALFIGLGDGWTLELRSALPMPPRLVLGEGPFLHPLLETLDTGRPAGVVIFSPEEARILEWRLGRIRALSVLESEYVQAAHERAGNIGGGPPGQFNSPVREHRQSRDRDRAGRFLDQVVNTAVQFAGDRGWGRILVSGGERWTSQLADAFPDALRDRVERDQRVLGGLDHAGLEAAVAQDLHEVRDARRAALVSDIRDAAHQERAALGLSQVVAALNSGRVANLLYDPSVRYAGSVDDNGLLYADDEQPPAGQHANPEPRLTERMVEQALRTGAQLTPISGAASNSLSDSAGIAALLRW